MPERLGWVESVASAAAHLAEEARFDRLVPFVGAGVSKDAGLPLWCELVAPLRESLAHAEQLHPVDVAQRYAAAHGRLALLKYLEVVLGRIRQPGALHWALAKLATSVVITTNYDQLLEQAIEVVHECPPEVVRVDDKLYLDEYRTSPLVIKLHGCLSDPATITVTRDDYTGYATNHPRLSSVLHFLRSTRTFLFVGFSLADDNVRAMLQQHQEYLPGSRRRAYVLDAHPEPSRHAAALLAAGWLDLGFQPVVFHSFDEQLAFIQHLNRASQPSTFTSGPDIRLCSIA